MVRFVSILTAIGFQAVTVAASCYTTGPLWFNKGNAWEHLHNACFGWDELGVGHVNGRFENVSQTFTNAP